MNLTLLEDCLRQISLQAGNEILNVYQNMNLDIEYKVDTSPVTQADKLANSLICEKLNYFFPDIPVVSEEDSNSHNLQDLKNFFLVDPLDGTKEFINKNGEFTVNIAYIEDKKAVRGVIFAPAINRLFYTLENGKSVEEHFPLSPSEYGKITKLKTKYNGESLIVVGSKSHFDSNTENYISSYNVLDFKSAGSSLKICLLATGEADFYPRLSPTMEWDIAAGHAILKGSGGNIYDSSLSEMKYSKDNFRNNKFVASLSGIKIDSF